jgi:hypothetical protein
MDQKWTWPKTEGKVSTNGANQTRKKKDPQLSHSF